MTQCARQVLRRRRRATAARVSRPEPMSTYVDGSGVAVTTATSSSAAPMYGPHGDTPLLVSSPSKRSSVDGVVAARFENVTCIHPIDERVLVPCVNVTGPPPRSVPPQ